MRKFLRTAVLAGTAALVAAGTALAAANDSRVMTVGLPDGSLARIEYRGDVAPKVTIEPVLQFIPVAFTNPAVHSPFVLVDRIAADMDRQMDALLRQARMLETAVRKGEVVDRTAFGNLPEGTVSYRFFSTSTGKGTCSRSIQVTSLGANQPKVVSSSSGDCDNMPSKQVSAVAEPQKAAIPAHTI